MKLEDLSVGQTVWAPHRRLYGAKVWREAKVLEVDLANRQVRANMAVAHVILRGIANAVTGRGDHTYWFPERVIAAWRPEPETRWTVSL
jgi:hypothetical protein